MAKVIRLNFRQILVAFCLTSLFMTESFALMDSKDVSFRGYLRAGLGTNSKEGEMVRFANPGTPGLEYRLGQETEYGAIGMTYHHMGKENKKQFNSIVYFDWGTDGNTTGEGSNYWRPRETYFRAHNLFDNGHTYWAGKRYYRDRDIHINDWYYLFENNGYGAGIKDITTGYGNWAIAILQDIQDQPATNNVSGTTDSSDLAANRVLDVRLTNTPLFEDHSLNSYLTINQATKGQYAGSELRSGYALGIRLRTKLETGANDFTIVYGKGLGHTLNVRNAGVANGQASTFNTHDSSTTGYKKGASRIRLVEHLHFRPIDNLTTNLAFTYEMWDTGQEIDNKGTWMNLGARFHYAVSDHFGYLLEIGHSSIKHDSEKSDDGANLGKRIMNRITFAPQISVSKKYWGRPVLRAFISMTMWNDKNKASYASNVSGVGSGTSFHDATNGTNIGFQGEVWF